MPITLDNRTFYRTSEVCRKAGISRSTLLRWLKEGDLKIGEYRDRRSWRLFTEADMQSLVNEANRICRSSEL